MRATRLVVLGLGLVLAACQRTEPDESAAEPVVPPRPVLPNSKDFTLPPAERPPLDYEATYDGKPITFENIYAYTEGSSATTIVFSTDGEPCSKQSIRSETSPDALYFEIRVAPVVAWDGSRQWHVIQKYFRSSNDSINDRAVWVYKDDANTEVWGRLEFEMLSFMPRRGKRVTYYGNFIANGCGDRTRHQLVQRDNDFEMVYAGIQFDIRGASIHKSGKNEYEIALSTSGEVCRSAFHREDLSLTFHVDESNIHMAAPPVRLMWLRGDLVRGDQTYDPKEVTVRVDGPWVGPGHVNVELSGTQVVKFSERVPDGRRAFRETTLEFNGTISARRCEDGTPTDSDDRGGLGLGRILGR